MVAAIIIIAVVLLVAAVAGYAAWKSSKRAVTPGQHHEALPPRQARQQPNQPGFTRLPPDARGTFKEQYRTKQGSSPPPPPGPVNGRPNTFGTVHVNLTAICKLTGARVADCTCDICTDIKKQV